MDNELERFLKQQRESEAQPVAPEDVEVPGFGSNTTNRVLRPEGTRPCPICGIAMETQSQFDVLVDVCTAHGVWLDNSELEALTRLRSAGTIESLKRTIDRLDSRAHEWGGFMDYD